MKLVSTCNSTINTPARMKAIDPNRGLASQKVTHDQNIWSLNDSCSLDVWRCVAPTCRVRYNQNIIDGKCSWFWKLTDIGLLFDSLMPSTHRRRRRDSIVELSRVGGVNAPVGSRDPVYNFLCCWATEVGDKWRHSDVIVQKLINIDQNSQQACDLVSWLFSEWSLFRSTAFGKP